MTAGALLLQLHDFRAAAEFAGIFRNVLADLLADQLDIYSHSAFHKQLKPGFETYTFFIIVFLFSNVYIFFILLSAL